MRSRHSPARRLALLGASLAVVALAGCMPPPPGGGTVTFIHTPASQPAVSQPAAPQPAAPLPPAPLPRLWASEFREAVAGMDGEWRVQVPRNSSCRLELAEPNVASRRGRVRQRGGCFGDVLFRVHGWTMTGTRELVLLDIMHRPLITLYGLTPILFRGEDLTLERDWPPARH